MRVALISKTFVFDAAQRQLEQIARQPGVELTLITPPEWRSDDGRVLPFVRHYTSGYAVRELRVHFNGRYHFYVYRGLRQTLKALAPDLVHIDEEPYNPAGAQAQRAADRLGARTIFITLQNIYRGYPPLYSLLEQYNYRHTAHIVACNEAAGKVLRRKGYRGPLSVFAVYGVDPDLYQPAPDHHLSAPSRDPFVIGYLGRLVMYKGLGVLIEALAGLPARCRLRLVGSGPDEALLRRLAQERGVAARVDFRPAVAATEVPGVLAGMDALALPSLTQPNWMEQFGRVLIEAMACGVPVVGSDSGEIPHVVGAAGLIAPEGNVEALRAALLRLSEEPETWARLARAGRERVLAHYTQEQAARRMVDVYRQAMAAQAPQGESV